VLSATSNVVQKLLHSFRGLLGLDALIDTLEVFNIVKERLKSNNFHGKLLLSGFSYGGAIAQLVSLKTNTPAVVFGANGIHDIASRVYNFTEDELSHSDLIFNFAEQTDCTPRMDCQVGHFCDVETETPKCDSANLYINRYITPGEKDYRANGNLESCKHWDFIYGGGGYRTIRESPSKIRCVHKNNIAAWNRLNAFCSFT